MVYFEDLHASELDQLKIIAKNKNIAPEKLASQIVQTALAELREAHPGLKEVCQEDIILFPTHLCRRTNSR